MDLPKGNQGLEWDWHGCKLFDVSGESEKGSFPRHTLNKNRPRSSFSMSGSECHKKVRDSVTEFFRIVELRINQKNRESREG
jgi:hypothetical protein